MRLTSRFISGPFNDHSESLNQINPRQLPVHSVERVVSTGHSFHADVEDRLIQLFTR